MDYKKVSRYVVLGILFFLPVTFLLFLYPATHNYTPLDIVNESILDIEAFTSDIDDPILLKDHITVLGFFGDNPEQSSTIALNLKELVYDKFKGFKRFQVVVLMPKGSEEAVKVLKAEISSYQDLRFWHFVYGEPADIKRVYFSLKTKENLSNNLTSNQVFVVDKDLNQRGRLDDRTDSELEKDKAVYGLYGYNCIEVSEIKNKMSDDLRILFTEYRQKRKGDFDPSSSRTEDISVEKKK
ncbi:hypothetical protein FPF71_02885 [Algibacter amylolyticus]|uniref:Membrane or secreted protein n=1 Tax=Algibacter amylolyticus TaxID=1608400 RepID=A0A5M7BEK6_9FLAO|nr:hypothetical protein [Algibacter amylolyticus]KAA5827799.1 hypothetical protein F2B50_02885 [Algibacter amylolyticus]MBB5267027.1 hypothetical protein [Algibacter amylolyticus]TSJ82044.1 hypothetical protein FPF71_02885 [Algibacter amylolyticus]